VVRRRRVRRRLVRGQRLFQRRQVVGRALDANALQAAGAGYGSVVDGGEPARAGVAAELRVLGVLLIGEHAVVEDGQRDGSVSPDVTPAFEARLFELAAHELGDDPSGDVGIDGQLVGQLETGREPGRTG